MQNLKFGRQVLKFCNWILGLRTFEDVIIPLKSEIWVFLRGLKIYLHKKYQWYEQTELCDCSTQMENNCLFSNYRPVTLTTLSNKKFFFYVFVWRSARTTISWFEQGGWQFLSWMQGGELGWNCSEIRPSPPQSPGLAGGTGIGIRLDWSWKIRGLQLYINGPGNHWNFNFVTKQIEL